MTDVPLQYLSVCSGIEAASVAWSPLGWQAAAFSEIDKFACAVLAHHYPDVPNLGDMRRYNEWTIDGTVDVLVGGTPCQSFSVAGLRGGMADPRGNLALVYLGIADRLRPRWIVWENVPGVLSSGHGRDFGSFVGALGQLGYGWAYRILDAQYCGVAQRRRRVFVVGFLGDWRRAAAVLFERESLRRDTAPRRDEGEGAAEGSAGGTRGDGSARRSGGANGTGRYAEPNGPAMSLRARPNCSHRTDTETCIPVQCNGTNVGTDLPSLRRGNGGVTSGVPAVAIPLDMRQASRGDRMTNNRRAGTSGGAPGTGIGNPGDPCPVIAGSRIPAIAFNARMDPVYGPIPGALDRSGHSQAIAFQESQSGCREYETAGTLRANGPGHDPVGTRIRRGWAVRRLTPRECERLQGFPDNYTLVPYRGKPAADGPRYRATGNSMAVPVMRWIGERIAAVEALA